MKRTALMACLLMTVTASAHAAWKDLRAGLDRKAAEQLVGAPLFGNQSRGGMYMNWVYDNGGYILFENGRVRFWQQPSDRVSGGVAALPVSTPAADVGVAGRNEAASAVAGQAGARGMSLRW